MNEQAVVDGECEFLTPQQLADKCNVSLKFVQKHTATRRLPGATKMGRLWRYRRTDVEKRLLSGRLLAG